MGLKLNKGKNPVLDIPIIPKTSSQLIEQVTVTRIL
jgi:hypothetical protein